MRETIGYLRRTLSRLDVPSRSIFAIIEGLVLRRHADGARARRRPSYMLDVEDGPQIALSEMNFGAYPMANGLSRLETHFCGEVPSLEKTRFSTEEARNAGLVTSTPTTSTGTTRCASRSRRASLSPDALTGMEASLRFAGPETMLTRVFGRLTAWQNWIFNRPNAVGEQGALKVYGTGAKAKFNWKRV